MKQFFHLLSSAAIVLFFQTAAFSQISITATDLTNYFGAGTSLFTYESTDTAMMNIGTASTSASQVWTAPSVNFEDSSEIDNVLLSSTPYASDFPGANYAQKSTSSYSGFSFEYYGYYRLSNDSLLDIGSVDHETGSAGGTAIDTSIVINLSQLVFHLPVQLGDVVTGIPDTVVEQGGIKVITTSSSVVDAYGTLNTPVGSFGALRSTGVRSTKSYSGSTLLSSSSTYSVEWNTGEGNSLSANIDTISSGTVKVYNVGWTRVGQTPTFVKMATELPGSFTLSQNYPNPFNPSTQIQFSVPQAGFVSLKVYDMLGREVATLVHQELTPSSYSITWNASNVASGVYLYKLDAGNYSVTKKMVLMK